MASFTSSKRRRHHDAARVTDFPAAPPPPPPLRIGEQEVQLQPSKHIRSAAALDAADLSFTAVTPLALQIGLLHFLFFPLSPHLHLHTPRFPLVAMASSDGLDEDCVLQRGRSQSDPSSIAEVRLGDAHQAGEGKEALERCTYVECLSSDEWSMLEEGDRKEVWMDGVMYGWLKMLRVHQTSAVFVNVRHFTLSPS